MLRLSVLAAAALAGAHACTTHADCTAADEFCQPAVAAGGAGCDLTGVAGTCVKRSGRGAPCGGSDAAAHACFRKECETTLACRPNSHVADPLLPGSCAKQCDAGGAVGMVFEGWTGAFAEAGKWCHVRYCDNAGVMQPTGGAAATACPTDLTDGLRCCVGAGEADEACCGTTGAWVKKDAADKVKCAGVEGTHGGTLNAPFSKTCTDACPATTTPTRPAYNDGWKGRSAVAGEWCNTCVCAEGTVKCTDRPCPALKCCPNGGTGDACCGVTGEWVTKNAADEVVCGGVTIKVASLPQEPFAAECATATRPCVVSTSPDVKILHGVTTRNPKAGQECNTCTCTDGVAVCETAACPPAQCCRGEKPTDGAAYVCCGIDGKWKKVDGTAKCGASVPTQDPMPATPGTASTGYPFSAACKGCLADVFDKDTPGWMKQTVPVGWTGPKQGGVWCDTCTCKVDGDPTVCTSVADVPACVAAHPTQCCSAAAPAPAAEYECCGATGRWVKKGANDEVVCGGVAFRKGDTHAAPLLGAACKADACTLTGGATKADGWGGRNGGANWCQLCSCDDSKAGTLAEPKLSCTTNTCTLRCCVGAAPATPGTWKCCAATGTWVKEDAAGTYSCGGVTVAAAADQLTDTMCPPATTDKCKLLNTAQTEVDQGWIGSGLGAKWCHNSCRCTAAEGGASVSCPTAACPVAGELKCCGVTPQPPNTVCCGLTGAWVSDSTGKCGTVDLAVTPTTGAPFHTRACPTCTVDGTEVAAGWEGQVSGAAWCNKCYCASNGDLRCTTKACPALRCCVGPAAGTCCGATGAWVTPDAGKVTCAGVTVTVADAATALPFGPTAVLCTDTCDNGGTNVPQGWAGKKAGDTCGNYCQCRPGPALACSDRTCPAPAP